LRRLLDKVMKRSDKGIENQPKTPSPLHELSYSDLSFMNKRGFLAMKICQYLQYNEEDYLFFKSFTNHTFEVYNEETQQKEFILYLSELMLKWSQQNLDIQQQVKKTELRHDIQNAMLKAYEMYKLELFTTPVDKDTNVSHNEANPDDIKWSVYRDVISAATQGQFLLISKEEVTEYKSGHVFCEGMIKDRSDIPLCRNHAKDSIENLGFNKTKIMSWLLVLSEAITNTIKHGEGGKMTLIEDVEKHEVRFVIEDKGPGFSLENLPKQTLQAGYSTKRSMGQGFTLMMKMTKQVLLYTSSKGSTIILIFDSSEEKVAN
jgi:anti-sigma regulatory factor (Ser/Thr protein kinase)